MSKVTDNKFKELHVGDAVMILGFNEYWAHALCQGLNNEDCWHKEAVGCLGTVGRIKDEKSVFVDTSLNIIGGSNQQTCLFHPADLERIDTAVNLDKVEK